MMFKKGYIVFFGLIFSLFMIGLPVFALDPTDATRVADLAIVVNDTPDPVAAGQTLAYEITVTNNGPDEALQVIVTIALSSQLSYQSGPAYCAESSGTVICELDHLSLGAETFGIAAVASAPENEIESTFGVVSHYPQSEDPNVANNSVVLDTNITAPLISMSVADLQVAEPESGTADALFTVLLSEVAAVDITVEWATSNGTAIAPDDFEQLSGTLLIPAGAPQGQIAVPVKSDAVLNEGMETFYINLSNPVNGTIQDGQAEAMIADHCLFCDHFDNNIMRTDWLYSKTTWTESNHVLQGTPDKRRALAIASPAFAGCSDCNVLAMMNTDGGLGNRLWLMAWYQNRANNVELIMKEERNVWVLKQRVGGVVTAKKKGSRNIEPGITYTVRIDFDGTTFQLYVNDEFLLKMNATATPAGTVGFKAKDTIGRFCCIAVY